MELVKNRIHMNQFKGNASTQITLDDDFIVPDTLDDMAQVMSVFGPYDEYVKAIEKALAAEKRGKTGKECREKKKTDGFRIIRG